MKYHALNLAAHLAWATGVSRIWGQGRGDLGSIIMGHSVVADPADIVDPQIQMSAAFLEYLLDYYIEQGVEILSLDDAVKALETGRSAEKPFVCFTFDDGYRDNLTTVLPIFERRAKPFTVYVCSAFIRRDGEHPWALVRHILRTADKISIPQAGIESVLSSVQDNAKIFRRIAAWMDANGPDSIDLHRLAADHGLSQREALDFEFLDIAQLRQLSRSPLVEIGGHTETHPRLTELTTDEAMDEIVANKRFLEAVVGREVRHFAYPFGDADSCADREFDLCERVGFASATTTALGTLKREHAGGLTALPRIRTNGSCETIAFMELQRSGALDSFDRSSQERVRALRRAAA